jgi:fluoroquinolone resistance protein
MSLLSKQTEYFDETFRKESYPGEVIQKKQFQGCAFTACSFTEVHFQDCKFIECRFIECDLSLVTVKGTSFSKVIFEKSKLIGINWIEATWEPLSSVGFWECNLNYSNFRCLNLRKTVMKKCLAHEADFANTNLTEADCTYTDFLESRFLQTNLTKADFTNASNYAIDATANTLKKTKFSLPEAISLLRSLDIVLEE